MRRLRSTPADALFSASICIMELRFGALKRGLDLWTRIEQQILPRIRVLPFTYKEAIKAGGLLHELYSIGRPIGIEDIIIAAIALENGLTLVSANTKHFSRIPDLKTENWLR